jgi:hypothetical protein
MAYYIATPQPEFKAVSQSEAEAESREALFHSGYWTSEEAKAVAFANTESEHKLPLSEVW